MTARTGSLIIATGAVAAVVELRIMLTCAVSCVCARGLLVSCLSDCACLFVCGCFILVPYSDFSGLGNCTVSSPATFVVVMNAVLFCFCG